MNGNWVEREERLIRLPEDDPEIFATYVNLVYTNVVATSRNDPPEGRESVAEEYETLSKLYVLSEKLCDIPTKNATLEAIFVLRSKLDAAGKKWSPTAEAAATIYAGSPAGCPGRRLMVDMFTCVDAQYVEANAALLPRDFFVDLALVLARERGLKSTSVAEYNGWLVYMEKLD